jgi:(p)ppGpp synthase/HD superfamily hydrolase
LVLAARAHQGQTRKGGDIPYIIHPVHVSVILMRYGFPEDVVAAGLLHDVVEDSDVPLACIEAGFGPAVAEMVGALTEQKREDGLARPWETRKREALDQLRVASEGAVAVKAADVLHSVRDLIAELERQGRRIWQHFSRGPEQSLWYYRSVAALVRERLGAKPLVDELEAAVEALDDMLAASESA